MLLCLVYDNTFPNKADRCWVCCCVGFMITPFQIKQIGVGYVVVLGLYNTFPNKADRCWV